MLLEQRAIRRTRILHSAIRMMHHARWGAPQAERLGERPNRQRVIEPRVGTPPDDAPRGEVEHDREIEPAFRRPQIRDVRGPHPIALALHRHTELPVELVRRQRQGMARLGRHAETPWTDAPQPIKAHEPRDALLRTPDPLRAQLGVDLRGAVALMTRRMGRADREAQPLILRSAVAGAPLVRRVEARGRHPERPTHESRLELAHMLSDAGVPHRDSFAKNAAAFFRKSRSWRSRSFSRRKRASSCSAVSGRGSRSVVSSSLYPRRLPGPGKISFGFAPLGAAAICLAQTRSRSGPSSSSSATRCRLTPVANRSFINRTTSTLNSGVCCRARFPLVVLMNTSSKHYLRCPPNRVNSSVSGISAVSLVSAALLDRWQADPKFPEEPKFGMVPPSTPDRLLFGRDASLLHANPRARRQSATRAQRAWPGAPPPAARSRAAPRAPALTTADPSPRCRGAGHAGIAGCLTRPANRR